MDELFEFSVKARNYKCFGEDEQGFECIKPFNIVIGRNNCGKSALLEILQLATDPQEASRRHNVRNGAKETEIIGDAPLSDEELSSVFHKGSTFRNSGASVWDFGQKFLGQSFKFLLNTSGKDAYLPEALTKEIKQIFGHPDASVKKFL